MESAVIQIPDRHEAQALSNRLEVREECSRTVAADLIRLLLCQAMSDGMSKLLVGVDPASGRPYLRYVQRDPAGLERCWDMVPPPAEMFPFLLQYVLLVTELEASMPLRGSASARKGDEWIRIAVAVAGPDAFELEWTLCPSGQ